MIKASEANQLELVLQRIGSEPFEAVRAREKSTFADFAGRNEERLILFGAGALGRLVLQGLKQAGLRPIAFADNNERLWDTHIESPNSLVLFSSESQSRAPENLLGSLSQ